MRTVILWVLGAISAGLLLNVLFSFIGALVLKICWNYVLPDLFGLQILTFWQSFSLLWVSRLLIRSSNWNHNNNKD